MDNKRASILIVDADEPIRRLLGEHISAHYTCVTARNAEEATALLTGERFNLLITDLKMPGDSGIELCRVAAGISPETVVIVMAEKSDVKCVLKAMQEGAYEFLLKPLNIPRVMKSVEHALRRQALVAAGHRWEQSVKQPASVVPNNCSPQEESFDSTTEALYAGYHSTVQALTGALAARDVETRGHSARVVAYCLRLGKEMGLPEREMIGLQQGALLHDIGKIGVPDAILLKPGSLTECERIRMSGHVVQGLRIIDGIESLAGASPVVGQHHEKFDGSGYPMGLIGESIHINARIFAVADAFDAITSNRPYRAASSYPVARAEIMAHAGTHFDPQAVDVFLKIPESEWAELRRATESQEYAEQVIGKREMCSFIASRKRRVVVTSPNAMTPIAVSMPGSPGLVTRHAYTSETG